MKTVSLGEVVDFYSGGTPARTTSAFWDGDVPWFSAKDMKTPRLTDSENHISEAVFSSTSLRKLPAGTVVMVVRGMILAHTAPIAILDVDAVINQDLKALLPRREIDPAFLAAMLRAQHSAILAQVSTAAHGTKKLDSRVLQQIRIPLPPIEEQRRIAAILDQADALRAKRRQIRAHLDTLAQSIFRSMFSDDPGDSRNLGDVAEIFGGASLPAAEPFTGQPGGVLLMKVSDMNAPGNEDEVVTCASWTSGSVQRSCTVEGGAVVLPKRGASIATNKKRLTTRRTTLDPNLMGVQSRTDILEGRYLYTWFKAFDLARITSGSTVPQLNKQDLAPLQIPVPPLDRQREFVARAEQINAQRAPAERALAAIEELFASLQARAFRGEL